MSQMINELLAEKNTMDKDEGAGQGTYDHSVAQGNEGAHGIVEAAKQGFALEQVNPVDQGTADKGGGGASGGSRVTSDVGHGYAGEGNRAEE